MGRKSKGRHKGRSARKRIAQTIANSAIQWVRLERSNVKLYRLEKRIAWRRGYHSHEKRAFVTTQPNRGRAMVKCGPVVYHVTALVDDKWTTKHFSTRSIKSTRIRGVHSPEYAIPTIGKSLERESRRMIVVGNEVRFFGFSSDDMVSLGLIAGRTFWKASGYMIVPTAVIRDQSKIAQFQSILSKNQF